MSTCGLRRRRSTSVSTSTLRETGKRPGRSRCIGLFQPVPDVQAGQPGTAESAGRTAAHAAKHVPKAQKAALEPLPEPRTPNGRPADEHCPQLDHCRRITASLGTGCPGLRAAASSPPTNHSAPGPTSSSSPTTGVSTKSICCCSRPKDSSWSKSRATWACLPATCGLGRGTTMAAPRPSITPCSWPI